MRAVSSSRFSWYRAIEAAEYDVDKTIREYQEELRSQNVIDNWPRRDSEFVSGNISLWSRYMTCHDNSAEFFVKLNFAVQLHTLAALAKYWQGLTVDPAATSMVRWDLGNPITVATESVCNFV